MTHLLWKLYTDKVYPTYQHISRRSMILVDTWNYIWYRPCKKFLTRYFPKTIPEYNKGTNTSCERRNRHLDTSECILTYPTHIWHTYQTYLQILTSTKSHISTFNLPYPSIKDSTSCKLNPGTWAINLKHLPSWKWISQSKYLKLDWWVNRNFYRRTSHHLPWNPINTWLNISLAHSKNKSHNTHNPEIPIIELSETKYSIKDDKCQAFHLPTTHMITYK